jgi:hypothetical protein
MRGMGVVKALRSPALAACLGTGLLGVGAGGCGGSNQAALNQAQQQGAAAAHEQDAITSLQQKVKTLEAQTGKQPQPSTGKAVTAPTVAPAPTGAIPDAGRIPSSGTYSGQAQQRGEPTLINRDFPMTMSFSSAGSSVSYPTLGCYGTLSPNGFAGQDRVYTEIITSGRCDSGGTWYVKVDNATQVEARWSLSTVGYTVAAVLTQ